MKKLFFFSWLIIFINLCYSQSKEEFLNDLSIYKEIVETSHSGMYLYTSKTTFDNIFKKAKEDIMNEKISSLNDFFILIASIHTKLNCGHSSVYPGDKIFASHKNTPHKKIFFPVSVKFAKDTLVVSGSHQTLKKGSIILSVNGVPTDEIVKNAFKIISSDGYNTTFKYRILEEEFAYYYLLLYKAHEEFDLEIIPYQASEKKSISINGVSHIKKETEEQEVNIDSILNLTYIDNTTALLTINSFSSDIIGSQRKFYKFLKNSFKEIKKKNIKNLIIDIRENTGGDDGNDMELASYLINRPFKENKFRKLNTNNIPIYPEYLAPLWFEMMGIPQKIQGDELKELVDKELKKEFYLAEDGHYYYKDNRIIKRDPKEHLFSGKTYILISGKVFSGGGLFSALVRDKSHAIFVGEETGGGYYRHTGSIPLSYILPNSKLSVNLFLVINEQDVEQKLFPDGSGTLPHSEVYPTIDDIVEGEDTILNFVKRKVKEQ